MSNQKEFERVDEYYEEMTAMLERLKRVNEDFNKDEGIEEDYMGPFNKMHELEGMVRKIRDDLLEYEVRKLNKSRCPNVTIEIAPLKEKLIEKFGDLGFNMKFISGYIGTHYVAHSEGMSRMEILIKAKHLLPVIWRSGPYGRKKLTVEDIVDGRKLVLHAYMDSIYGNTRDGVIALDKLIRMTLDDLPAAKVVSYSLLHVFRLAPYSTHEMSDDHIEKMRAYKNHKLFIYFKTEEKAQRVAEALLK